MPCTTLLVGKKATFDGSTFAARNEDAGAGHYNSKKFIAVKPEEQPRHYRSVLSHVEIDLPDNPLRYTAMPNGTDEEGIWGAAGVNSENISMTATETLTTNSRVLAIDPLVCLIPEQDGKPEIPGGIGEEDMVTLVLPYIHSAREGVLRLGSLLETYGTYEMNGIAFQDEGEIWWLETIGGHQWIAKRVPDDAYVVMPNQLGIDRFDFKDACGEGKEHMCSKALPGMVRTWHLDVSLDGICNPRDVFGSRTDSDHVYNTPRAWFIQRYFNPHSVKWDGPEAALRPDSDDIPWARVPEKKITVEDAKYVLSSHFQGTPYDPYGRTADPALRGSLRPIGINRNNFLSLVQIRPDLPKEIQVIEWLALASNTFNALVPFYANVEETPAYLASAGGRVTTEEFYWTNRLIGALADATFAKSIVHVERYQQKVPARGLAILLRADETFLRSRGEAGDREVLPQVPGLEALPPVTERVTDFCQQVNQQIADMLREETDNLLGRVLLETTEQMKNHFSRSDS